MGYVPLQPGLKLDVLITDASYCLACDVAQLAVGDGADSPCPRVVRAQHRRLSD